MASSYEYIFQSPSTTVIQSQIYIPCLVLDIVLWRISDNETLV